ncbi:sensor histidine kinase [Paenibacillus antri]|uniref:histidine kinase n=1 Tax=Paenibacillus antri TaxID=2582848 RepID=A0A5R9GKZ6_9BACL|nr:sensor histidine kinase [Paenibacillus antri]TLS52425.1 sensor histidine kinase [Paenibacillus antri]
MTPLVTLVDLMRRSVQWRLTFYFLLILTPIIAVSLYALDRSEQIVREQVDVRTREAMLSSMDQIDMFMNNVDQLTVHISGNKEMNRLLTNQDSPTKTILNAVTLKRQIVDIALMSKQVENVWMIVDPLGTLISPATGGRPFHYADLDWYQATIAAQGGVVLILPSQDAPQPHPQQTYMYGDPAFDPAQNAELLTLTRKMGLGIHGSAASRSVVGVSVSKKTLLEFGNRLLFTDDSHIFLVSPQGELIASTLSEPASVPWREWVGRNVSGRRVPYSSDPMYVTSVSSQSSDWSMILIQPERLIKHEPAQLQRFTVVMIAVSLLLACGVSLVVYSGIASPMRGLLNGMRQWKSGNRQVQLPNYRKDEFGLLTEEFNRMVELQDRYIRESYEHLLQKTETELKFLQSQINPHFLYNTLDSIYWETRNYEAGASSEMVLCLSKFFRLSLMKGRQAFTMQETMEHLKYYIRIQQLRFGDSIAFEQRISPESAGLFVLKLILQPLVENAIVHGLEKKPGGGTLTISSGVEGDDLVIRVEDTGNGIPEERLRYIREELDKVTGQSLRSFSQPRVELFGLANVQTRLKLYYGEGSGVVVESEGGRGTRSVVRIPVELCGSESRGGGAA